jgi:uncharacterized membrane protein
MGSVAHYVEVNVPVERAYSWWRGLTRLPAIMPDVQEVSSRAGAEELTHWKVRGPLGKSLEWDARIVEDVPNTRIAWATVANDATQVENAGAVRFDQHGETTGVEVSLQYDPPAGKAGEVVAALFSNPQKKVEQALEAFKQTIETATPSSDFARTEKKG